MKIIRLQTQGFKRVTAVDITPEGALVRIGGDNGEGKTSLLDSIMAGLGGAGAAPIKPIRTGDDFAAIRIELGDGKPALVVTKYFDEVGEKLRVENADGAVFEKGQTEVGKVLGRMTFDPLAFARMNPQDQAVELRRLVPLKVDLDQLAAADKADTLARRDVNRDAKALKARLDVIPVEADLPEDKPDLNALTTTLASAADTNTAIERERNDRDSRRRAFEGYAPHVEAKRDRAAALRREADELIAQANRAEQEAAEGIDALDALPPLDTPVDTTAARTAIDEARAVLDRFARQEVRDQLLADFNALKAKSEGFTAAIDGRATERAQALAEADMPVPGLALARLCDVVPGDEATDLIVTYEGEPFAQASGAQQLRVSMRLAMAANPKLRVMLIREGALLDPKSLAIVGELATEGDYQVWLETVGEGDGSGLIMEAGAVRGAPEPERLEGPKRRKAKGEGEDTAKGNPAPASTAEVTAKPRDVNAPAADPAPADPAQDGPTLGEQRARRRPSSMREFTTPKPGGDLFGGEE